MRSNQKVKERVGPIKDGEGNIILSKPETAETLNKFFSEVFTKEDNIVPTMTELYDNDIEKLTGIYISDDMVIEKLKELENGKATGPDGIATDFLKELAEVVAMPLSLIYSKSLNDAEIPEDWKAANITPLFKKGLRSDVSNYRPVNLTAVPGKVMETY